MKEKLSWSQALMLFTGEGDRVEYNADYKTRTASGNARR